MKKPQKRRKTQIFGSKNQEKPRKKAVFKAGKFYKTLYFWGISEAFFLAGQGAILGHLRVGIAGLFRSGAGSESPRIHLNPGKKSL